jgi:hypothetical protein
VIDTIILDRLDRFNFMFHIYNARVTYVALIYFAVSALNIIGICIVKGEGKIFYKNYFNRGLIKFLQIKLNVYKQKSINIAEREISDFSRKQRI